jgi:hypothetical protein
MGRYSARTAPPSSGNIVPTVVVQLTRPCATATAASMAVIAFRLEPMCQTSCTVAAAPPPARRVPAAPRATSPPLRVTSAPAIAGRPCAARTESTSALMSRGVAAAGGAGVGGAVGGAGAGPVQAAASSSTETVRPRAPRRTGARDGA